MTSSADYPTSSLPIVISPDPPGCQSDCQLWFDCTNNQWMRCDGLGTWIPLPGGGGTSLHANLLDLNNSGHPGSVIQVGGLVGGIVVAAADGTIENSGAPPAGAAAFTDLTDTPPDYTGQQGKLVKVNATENGLIYGDPSGASVSWGDILGTLSDQTDLQAELDAKEDAFAKNTAFNRDFGTLAGDVCQGNDGRLSDARTPLAHAASHGQGQADEITPAAIAAATAAQGALADSAMQPNDLLTALSSGAAALGQVPKADGGGNITWENESGGGAAAFTDLTDTPANYVGQQGKLVKVNATEDGLIYGDPSGASVSWGDILGTLSDQTDLQGELDAKEDAFAKNSAFNRDFGTLAGDVCQGNDARLSDARTPTAHAATHATGQADEIAPVDIGAEPAFSKNSAFNRDFGTLTNTVCEGNDARLSDARVPTAHAATHATGQADEIAPADIGALSAVIDDTDPYVGGDLKIGGTNNYVAVFTDVLNAEQGSAGYTDTPKPGVYLAYAPAGVYSAADGGVLAIPGALEAHGTAFQVESIAHSSTTQQVFCTPEGILYGADPPPAGWSDSAVDAGSYDLGTGSGVGAWVPLTGAVATVQSNVGAGDRLEIQAYVTAVNKTTNRSGTIEIGFGLDGAAPTVSGDTHSIVGGFSGSLPAAVWSWSTHGGLTAGQTISVWGRRTFGEHSQFGVDLVGTTDNHVLEIFVHGGGGAAAPTDISISYSPTAVTVESSTGQNDSIAQAIAGGNAGVMSGADKTKVDAAWEDGSTVGDWGLTPQNLGSITGNTQVDLDNGHDFTGTMDGLGDWDVDFISTRGHAATHWSFTMDVAGRAPVWKFNGAVIDLTEGYDISTGASRYEFSFRRNASGTSVSVIGVQ